MGQGLVLEPARMTLHLEMTLWMLKFTDVKASYEVRKYCESSKMNLITGASSTPGLRLSFGADTSSFLEHRHPIPASNRSINTEGI